MSPHQLIAFEECGFYRFDPTPSNGWDFQLEFNHRPDNFRLPELLLIPPDDGRPIMGLTDLESTEGLIESFRRLQAEELQKGRMIPALPLCLSNGCLEGLLYLHRQQWEEGEHHRLALGA
jgi:hypothetical protein